MRLPGYPCQKIATVLAAAFCLVMCWPRDAAAADSGELLLETKLPAAPGYIMTHAEIEGQKCLMLVDTGAEYTILDNSLRDIMKGKATPVDVADGEGRRVQGGLYQIPELRVQSLVAREPSVVLMDLQPVSKGLGPRLQGALGAAQLKAGKVTLDYDAGVFKVHTGEWQLKEATESDLEDYRPLPIFEATISGRHGEFILDTGYDACIALEASLFTALVRNGSIEVADVTGHGLSAAGATSNRRGWFLKGELMGRDLKGVSVQSVVGNQGAGMIGAGWMCAFNIEIDYQAHKWRFQKRAQPAPPLSIQLMTGAFLTYPGKGARIERLRPDGAGAAEKAGLHAGDLIQEMDLLREDQIDYAAVAELVTAKAGQRVKVQYLRAADGQQFRTTLEIPPPISDWDFAGRDIFKKAPQP